MCDLFTMPIALLRTNTLTKKSPDNAHVRGFMAAIKFSTLIISVAFAFVEVVFCLTNIRKSPDKCKYTYILLQVVIGATSVFTGGGLFEVIKRLLWIFLVAVLHGNVIKVIWCISAASSVLTCVIGAFKLF